MPSSWKLTLLLLLGILLPAAAGAKPLDPGLILMKADYILMPKGSFEYSGAISVQREAGAGEEWKFSAAVLDPLHRRAFLQAPAAARGQSLLLDNEEFWLYLPKIKKAVRVPPQSAFAGDLSNADFGQPFFSMSYQAARVESDILGTTPVYVLRMAPRFKDSPYSRVKLWVERESFKPIQAEYFGAGGALLKTLRFEDFREELGMARPQRWVYQDAGDPAKQTVLTLGKMARKEFDPKAFEPRADPHFFSSPELRPKSASGRTRPRLPSER